jgi:hypothetical protein
MTVLKSLAALVRQWEIAFGEKPAEIAMHPYLVHMFMSECQLILVADPEDPIPMNLSYTDPITYDNIPIRPDHNCPYDRIYLAQKIDVPPLEVF